MDVISPEKPRETRNSLGVVFGSSGVTPGMLFSSPPHAAKQIAANISKKIFFMFKGL